MPFCHPGYVGILALLWLAASASARDWASEIRQAVDTGHLSRAATIANEWTATAPRDAEARFWHARIAAWEGRTGDAEKEFRELSQEYPNDADVLTALARVVQQRGSPEEALTILARACPDPTLSPDCGLARARVLVTLKREEEARALYRQLLAVETARTDARHALSDLRENGRLRLRATGSADLMSFSGNAATFATQATWDVNPRWIFDFGVTQRRRFEMAATGVEMLVTRRLPGGVAVTLGGGGAGKQILMPRSHFLAAVDRGFRISTGGPVRAIEAVVEQRWNRYADSALVATAPAAILYFAHGWEWLAGATVSGLRGAGTRDWRAAGQTRVSFPSLRGVGLSINAGTGAENFGTIEQLRFRSSKSVGATASIRLRAGQSVTFSARYQRIAGGATLTGYESAYVLRF